MVEQRDVAGREDAPGGTGRSDPLLHTGQSRHHRQKSRAAEAVNCWRSCSETSRQANPERLSATELEMGSGRHGTRTQEERTAVEAPTGCWERKLGNRRGQPGEGPRSQQPPHFTQASSKPKNGIDSAVTEVSPDQGAVPGAQPTRVGAAPAQNHLDRISPHFPFPAPKPWDPEAIFTPREV